MPRSRGWWLPRRMYRIKLHKTKRMPPPHKLKGVPMKGGSTDEGLWSLSRMDPTTARVLVLILCDTYRRRHGGKLHEGCMGLGAGFGIPRAPIIISKHLSLIAPLFVLIARNQAWLPGPGMWTGGCTPFLLQLGLFFNL